MRSERVREWIWGRSSKLFLNSRRKHSRIYKVAAKFNLAEMLSFSSISFANSARFQTIARDEDKQYLNRPMLLSISHGFAASISEPCNRHPSRFQRWRITILIFMTLGVNGRGEKNGIIVRQVSSWRQ